MIEPAWWDSAEPGPARDSLVQVQRATDGTGWLARPMAAARPSEPAEAGQPVQEQA